MTVYMKLFQPGTRVACSLPYAGTGIVFDIHGAQVPESVETLQRGVGVRGGNARLDVVFLNGTISRNLSEALVRGSVQWKVLDDVASADEVKSALEHARAEQARREASARTEAEQFAAEVERLKSSPEFAHLVQGDDRYSGVLAGKNIRQVLKRAFPAVKFSVRKTSYGSLAIEWTDGPTETDIEGVTSSFKAGYFCGQEDIYKREKTPWNEVFGAAEYITVRRNHSTALIERVISSLFADWRGTLEGIEQPSAEQFERGELFTVRVPGLADTLQQVIRQTLYRTCG
ncbi:TPA: hypothetical protein P8734_005694 [Pseudomonas aeruginosa]|nr:hypothetical protein [Pseudomonas aeruginosa]